MVRLPLGVAAKRGCWHRYPWLSKSLKGFSFGNMFFQLFVELHLPDCSTWGGGSRKLPAQSTNPLACLPVGSEEPIHWPRRGSRYISNSKATSPALPCEILPHPNVQFHPYLKCHSVCSVSSHKQANKKTPQPPEGSGPWSEVQHPMHPPLTPGTPGNACPASLLQQKGHFNLQVL